MLRHETMGDLAEQGFTKDQILDALRILPFVCVLSTDSSLDQGFYVWVYVDQVAPGDETSRFGVERT